METYLRTDNLTDTGGEWRRTSATCSCSSGWLEGPADAARGDISDAALRRDVPPDGCGVAYSVAMLADRSLPRAAPGVTGGRGLLPFAPCHPQRHCEQLNRPFYQTHGAFHSLYHSRACTASSETLGHRAFMP
jgi:hypothetical protein